MDQQEELRFDGDVVLVTGAGHGLGRAHALLLAERGARVRVNDLGSPTMGGQDHDPGPAQSVVDEIRALGGEAEANSDTVATRDGGAAMVAQALDTWGRLDAVINNAGIIRNRTFMNIGEYEFEPVLDVHGWGDLQVEANQMTREGRWDGMGDLIVENTVEGVFQAWGTGDEGRSRR